MSKTENAMISVLSGFFFASGISALIYQVSWQRLLFSAFGVDIESVTIIVASFMLGLGVGALVGGYLADRFPRKTLLMFALAEGGVGLFGLISPHVFHYTGEFFLYANTFTLIGINLILVILPTTLMGATLPILVAHLSRLWGNVGRSTGEIYSANTLGATIGALLSGFVLFRYIELNDAIYLAAGVNVLVALGVSLFVYMKGKSV